jgi:hypothetical protein
MIKTVNTTRFSTGFIFILVALMVCIIPILCL